MDTGAVEEAICFLQSAYKRKLQLAVGSEPAERPSLLWRGDHVVLDDDLSRWATRIWLADNASGYPESVGFANLRDTTKIRDIYPGSIVPVIADAFLAVPFHMKGSPYSMPLSSDFGVVYGEPAKPPVTCYARPYMITGGVCAHACIYMASVMMTRLDYHVPMVHEISLTAAKEATKKAGKIEKDGCFEVVGLSLLAMQQVLGSAPVGGEAVIEDHSLPEGPPKSVGRAVKFIREYLRQGLPVILRVDVGKLYPEMRPWLEEVYRGKNQKEFPHVVLLIGEMHKQGDPDEITSFVYHDSLKSPFMEQPAAGLLASGKFPIRCQNPKEKDIVSYLVPVPKGAGCSMTEAIEIAERYFPKGRDHPWHATLISQKNLAKRYFGHLPESHPVRKALREGRHRLPSWTWVIEVYADTSDFRKCLASAACFVGKRESDLMPKLYAWWQDEVFQCVIPGLFLRESVGGPMKLPPTRVKL